jgi:hypothetical protein
MNLINKKIANIYYFIKILLCWVALGGIAILVFTVLLKFIIFIKINKKYGVIFLLVNKNYKKHNKVIIFPNLKLIKLK